jgi:hypothetical protein
MMRSTGLRSTHMVLVIAVLKLNDARCCLG